MLEGTILQEIILIRYIIRRLSVHTFEHLPCHLHGGRQALSCLIVEKLTYAIQVIDICSEALQPSEEIRADAFQITDSSFQSMLGIRLHAIQDIHIWCILANGHHSNETLAVRIPVVVATHQGIAFLESFGRRHPFHLGDEVIELQPVQTIFAIIQVTDAYGSHTELIRLGDIPVVFSAGIAVVLLHHNNVTRAQRVIQLTPLRIEHHPMRLGVVVVHLHHVAEEAVGILAQQLRNDHFIHPQRVADGGTVDLEMILVFHDTGSVHHLFFLDRPPVATEEGGNEIRTGEGVSKHSVTQYLDGRDSLQGVIIMFGTIAKLSIFPHPELLQFCSTLRRNDTALQPSNIFAEDDGTKGDETFKELRFIEDSFEYDIAKLSIFPYPELLQFCSTIRRNDAALQPSNIFAQDDGTKGDETFKELRFIEDSFEYDIVKFAGI